MPITFESTTRRNRSSCCSSTALALARSMASTRTALNNSPSSSRLKAANPTKLTQIELLGRVALLQALFQPFFLVGFHRRARCFRPGA